MAKRQKNRLHNGQKTEEQTTQWPKEKVAKDKQRSTKHTYKAKDRVTRTPLKTRGELKCSTKFLTPGRKEKIRFQNKVLFFVVQLENFEYTNDIIRSHKSRKIQYNGQKKEDKVTNNDLQNIHIKLKIE
jgi:hypothetical protein